MIDEFAFCFLSYNLEDVLRQEMEITPLSNKYQIERWYRHDRNLGHYQSFSQMINEAIDDTESEFMIFCNPKTYFTQDDVEFLLEKLSSGYCFVSSVGFGFFGFSKELIRHIGMLDERFLGGEYEDDDFAIRLNYFGKAAWWDYDTSKYLRTASKSINFRHISRSIFLQKYHIQQNEIEINKDFFIHKKISKRHRKHNNQIYSSWLDSSRSRGDCKISKYLTNFTTKLVDKKFIESEIEFVLDFKRDKKDFRVEINSYSDFKLNLVFVKSLDEGRIFQFSETVDSNTWATFEIFNDKDLELRMFLNGNQIYNNIIEPQIEFSMNFKLPTLIES